MMFGVAAGACGPDDADSTFLRTALLLKSRAFPIAEQLASTSCQAPLGVTTRRVDDAACLRNHALVLSKRAQAFIGSLPLQKQSTSFHEPCFAALKT